MIPLLLSLAVAAPLHPPFPVLDAAGVDVLSSGAPYAPDRTCGACHDVAVIDRHATHSGATVAPPTGALDLAWEWGTGLLGRWDPLRYTVVAPHDLRAWASTAGQDHAGGGPLAPLGVATDCVLCHLSVADDGARRAALAAGELALANTATLAGTGLVTLDPALPGGLRWNAQAFEGGMFPISRLPLGPATAERCGSCHGTVYRAPAPLSQVDGRATLATGVVYSGQRIDRSGLNLASKDTLDRAWDVHAERLLDCADCHGAGARPSRRIPDDAPEHLRFDPRAPALGEYLKAPSHQLSPAEATCTGCHDPSVGHDFLPGADEHFAALACTACHVPDVRFAARQELDWTALDAQGQPLQDWRGTDGDPSDPRALQAGSVPLLLPVQGKLTPHQVSSVFWWETDAGPVPREVLAQVWADVGALAALDADHDGALSSAERRLDTTQKAAVVAERLRALGVIARIAGMVEAYPVSHGVARGDAVVRDCTTCHAPEGRLHERMQAAAWLPGGVTPTPRGAAKDRLVVGIEDGSAWAMSPDTGRYVFAAGGFMSLDKLGLAAFVGAWLFALGHGGLRWWAGHRHGEAK